MLNHLRMLNEKFEQEPPFIENPCIATRIMVKRRQVLEAKEALKSLKVHVLSCEDAFKLRENSLQEKNKQIQDSRVEFDKLLQENEKTRNRALRRLSKEQRAIGSLDSEIAFKRIKLLQQQALEEALRKECEKKFRHRNYLLHVVEHLRGTPNDFAELQDILNRYNTLKQVNIDLERRQHACALENEKRRRDLLELTKVKSNELLQYNNEIASLQKHLDDLSLSSQRQSTCDETTPIGHDLINTAIIGQVRTSVQNLLLRFENYLNRSTRNLTTTEEEIMGATEQRDDNEATENALVRIAEHIVDYSTILDEWQSSRPTDRVF